MKFGPLTRAGERLGDEGMLFSESLEHSQLRGKFKYKFKLKLKFKFTDSPKSVIIREYAARSREL